MAVSFHLNEWKTYSQNVLEKIMAEETFKLDFHQWHYHQSMMMKIERRGGWRICWWSRFFRTNSSRDKLNLIVFFWTTRRRRRRWGVEFPTNKANIKIWIFKTFKTLKFWPNHMPLTFSHPTKQCGILR